MRARSTLRDPIFWLTAVAYGIAFVVTGNAVDDDNAAGKDIGLSAYLLWAKIISTLSATSLVPLVYGAFVSHAVATSLRARNWAAALFFLNPFVITNICDVYNRFTLSLFLATLASHALQRGRLLTSGLSSAAFAALHPINLVFLAFAVSPMVAIGIPASLSAAQTLLSWDVFTELFPDKVELYRQFGDNIALTASGNFQIDPEVLTNGSFVSRFVAAAFPGAFSVNEAWWLPLVALFIAAWYALVLSMSKNPLTCALLAAASITTLSLVVGNSAVLARHFLPLFYFSLLLFSQKLSVSPMWLGVITVAGAARPPVSRRQAR